jgi:hypothetical protein
MAMGAFKIVACMRNVTAKLSLGEPPFGVTHPATILNAPMAI